MIEIWQADPQGRYEHPADTRGANMAFRGFGRCGTGTDPEKRFVFDTLKPGAADDSEAPHINVIVFMRGLLSHLYTRVYFADEEAANARSEEHTSELQSLMRISYAVFCLKKKRPKTQHQSNPSHKHATYN